MTSKSVSVLTLSALLLLSVPAQAANVTLKLGKFVSNSSGEDGSALKIVGSQAVALSSSDTSTLSWAGCHSAKTDSNEGSPYDKAYTPFEITRNLLAIQNDSPEKANELILIAAEENLDSVKRQNRDQMRFYCSTNEIIGVTLDVLVVNTQRVARVVLALMPSSEGFYVETPCDRLYVNESAIDVFETPSL